MPPTPEEEIIEIANADYSGRQEDAFPYWALSCVVADQDPERDALREHVAVGDGDLGIDGYWIDDSNRRLVLLQAKYTTRLRRDDVGAFRTAIETLIDQEYVLAHANNVIQQIYPELLEALIDDSYTISAVVACGGTISRALRSLAETISAQSWQFTVGDEVHTKDIQLEIFGIADLVSRRDEHLRHSTEPVVSLPITVSDGHPSFHYMDVNFMALQATVLASTLVDAYAQYGPAIFKHNPRGPLGSNKVNKEIRQTLEDPNLRPHFHLLNNGLTSICRSVVHNEVQQTLDTVDFQIVNGCQTVYTLYKLREHVTDEVKLTVRIVEGFHESWADRISKASNYQTAVRPEQLASLGTEHDAIQRTLDSLSPPWYYEKQKGYGQFLSAAEKRMRSQRYGRRIVTPSEVGKLAVAFLGRPARANYDLQWLFNRRDEESQGLYSLIFSPEIQADQLLLPVTIGREVDRVVRNRVTALRREHQSGSPGPAELSWLSFAKMHIIALIGVQLRAAIGQGEGLLEGAVASQRLTSIDGWFDDMFGRARSSVEFYMSVALEVAQATGTPVDRRVFFRDVTRYRSMVDRVRSGWS